MNDVAVRVARFAGVGGFATLVHVTAAFAANRAGLSEPLLANTFGFLSAFMVTYLGNYYWTFPGLGEHRTSFVRFIVLAVSAFALSTVVVYTTSTVLGWPFTASLLMVAVTVPPVNLMVSWLWVFRRRDGEARQPNLDLLVLLAGIVAAFAYYSGTILNHDTSWYLIATPRWLDGAELYRDIVEINPPLAFYLTAPAVLLSRATGLALNEAFVLQVIALSLASLVWFRDLLRRSPVISGPRRSILLAAAFAALCVTPVGDFGQREHLMVIFALPYIGLMAFSPASGPLERGLTGGFALLGLALKPYFLALPLFMALLMMARQRRLVAPFTPEHLVIGGGCILYAMAIWLVHPLYITDIVPLGRLVYEAYEASMDRVLLVAGFFALPSTLALTYGLPKGPDRDVAVTLLAATAAFVVAYLVQFKGWGYQRIPIYSALTLWCSWLAVAVFRSRNRGGMLDVTVRSVLLATAVAPLSIPVLLGPYQAAYQAELAPYLRGARSFLALTTNVSVTYPLANLTGAEPTTRYSALWLIPGAVTQLASGEALDGEKRRALEQVLERARRTTTDDFIEGRPEVVIVDARGANRYFDGAAFDYLAFFQQDPRFRDAWQHYTHIGTESGFEVWRRM